MLSYHDSQSTVEENNMNNSQELFGNSPNVLNREQPGAVPRCTQCKNNEVLLQQILKELQEVKSAVNIIQQNNANCGGARSSVFVVEKSPIEGPLTEYIKQRFAQCPFIDQNDVELKNKVIVLRRRCNITDVETTTMVKSAISFTARKMVDYRSQVKNKLIGTKNKDAGVMGLTELCQYLLGKFDSSGSEDQMNFIVSLRSFCHEEKLLRKQREDSNEIVEDFWRGYRSYRKAVDADEEENKWGKLKSREERRIERYRNM